ncbi:hypothetical protein C8R43DRAFT_839189, partial [Mycena crocata]
MGEGWERLVTVWWGLEESTGFISPTKTLPTGKRPDEIGSWVKHARGAKPAITMPKFATEWVAWWRDINPPWRMREGELVREGTGSWDCMRFPGQNGFLNVVIALKWWREALEEESVEWRDAVLDVTWVIERM